MPGRDLHTLFRFILTTSFWCRYLFIWLNVYLFRAYYVPGVHLGSCWSSFDALFFWQQHPSFSLGNLISPPHSPSGSTWAFCTPPPAPGVACDSGGPISIVHPSSYRDWEIDYGMRILPTLFQSEFWVFCCLFFGKKELSFNWEL